MEEFAFDVHPICYKQYGICNLPPGDYWRLKDMLHAVDIQNLMKNPRRSWVQFQNVYEACREQFIESAEDTLFKIIMGQLSHLGQRLREMSGKVFEYSPTENSQRTNYFNSALAIVLYGNADKTSKVAAELYDREFNSIPNVDFVKQKEITNKCFTSLGQGISDDLDCSPIVASDFKNKNLKQMKTKPTPLITEDNLNLILKMSARSM